jgi:anti-anti-sigma factor
MSQDQQEDVAIGLRAWNAPSSAAAVLSEADRIIVTVDGQLDVDSQAILALTLAKAITAGRVDVALDLEDLDSIDPEDVGLLIRARSLLRSQGQHLVVRSPYARAALAACALLDPLACVENEATSRFSKGP